MFKSTKEFDSAILEILLEVRNCEVNANLKPNKYDNESHNEALAKCVDDGLLTGVTYERKWNEPEFNILNVRITYDGLKFIENQQG